MIPSSPISSHWFCKCGPGAAAPASPGNLFDLHSLDLLTQRLGGGAQQWTLHQASRCFQCIPSRRTSAISYKLYRHSPATSTIHLPSPGHSQKRRGKKTLELEKEFLIRGLQMSLYELLRIKSPFLHVHVCVCVGEEGPQFHQVFHGFP